MGDSELEVLFPVYMRKSHCWTVQHKYPLTTHNVDYLDWRQDPVCSSKNHYLNPVRPTHPLPILKRFRPLQPMGEKEEKATRLTMYEPQGRKTPLEAFHFGYRKFSLNPAERTLRKFDDPLPHPLHTVKRESYVDYADTPHLLFPQNYQRYGLTPRQVATGIVPLAAPWSSPAWSEDTLFEQQQQKKQQQKK